MDRRQAREATDRVVDAVTSAVVAERRFVETVLLGVLSRGHVLLEDAPGTGKTLTARCVAAALGLSFSRIQFTPDLLPADVTGSHVFDEADREFEFRPGPVFGNLVLADEINRAPPKTQSALLEAMEEHQVTVDGETHALPAPFLVIATQNPVEHEGTFGLPAAQVDRFAVKTRMGYPDVDGERELLRRRASRETRSPSVAPVLDLEAVRSLQRVPETVRVDPDVIDYQVDLVRGTREDPRVELGVSPRGTQRLFEVSRARATLEGRDYVTPDHVKAVAPVVLAHRLVLTPAAQIDGVDAATVVRELLRRTPVPTVEGA